MVAWNTDSCYKSLSWGMRVLSQQCALQCTTFLQYSCGSWYCIQGITNLLMNVVVLDDTLRLDISDWTVIHMWQGGRDSPSGGCRSDRSILQNRIWMDEKTFVPPPTSSSNAGGATILGKHIPMCNHHDEHYSWLRYMEEFILKMRICKVIPTKFLKN